MGNWYPCWKPGQGLSKRHILFSFVILIIILQNMNEYVIIKSSKINIYIMIHGISIQI